jgi:putative N6-adenine-specific DNA methylase
MGRADARYRIFVVCAPGLEPFLREELLGLGLAANLEAARPQREKGAPDAETGGIELEGSLGDVYRLNLWLRTATRVLVRVSTVRASTFDELRDKVGRMPWNQYLAPGRPVALRVACHRSRLYHTDAVGERVGAGIEDRLGRKIETRRGPEEETEDFAAVPQLIVVRVVRDRATISVDSSGESLHRRGYRLATAKAPLRETLAAAMILASGWDRTSPLVDPFCGSGTIPTEAALLARNAPPGAQRRFAFMDWPGFKTALWQNLLGAAGEAGRGTGVVEHGFPAIQGSDRDAGAVESARANALRAGMAEAIEFTHRAASAIEPPSGPGWIVTNPPYGHRIGGSGDLRDLYAAFGNVLRARCPGWHVAILCGDPRLVANSGLPFDEGLPLQTGGIPIRLHRSIVPSNG